MILNRPTRRLRNPASSSHSKARAVAANSPLSFEGVAVYRVMLEPYTSPSSRPCSGSAASPCCWAGWRSSESRRPGHGLDGSVRRRRGRHDPGVWGFTVLNALGALLVLGPLAATLLRRTALASLPTPQT